jgi:gamma-glutamyl-gamma-aminobutyrate hydrolase PuuD
MLGICRGCQIINVALGGTVRNLRKDEDVIDRHMVLTGHAVELVPDSNLAQTTLSRPSRQTAVVEEDGLSAYNGIPN